MRTKHGGPTPLIFLCKIEENLEIKNETWQLIHQHAYFNIGKGEKVKKEIKRLPMMRKLEQLGLIGEDI